VKYLLDHFFMATGNTVFSSVLSPDSCILGRRELRGMTLTLISRKMKPSCFYEWADHRAPEIRISG